tara:strand:- start:231 stop:716 length:486 start_codon:yes stop_codon:yes gene_type:complete
MIPKNDLPKTDIKGKDYVLVKDRVIELHNQCDKFNLTTEIISDDDKRVVMKTTLEFDGCFYTGIASELKNQHCAYENCETSSVGRCLGFFGIGIIESIASADEMRKFHNNKSNDKPKPASEKQLYLIKLKCEQNGINPSQYLEEELTMQQAREIIEQLKGE